MKTILFMATSVNGYIAGEDGNEDFLSHTNWESFSEKVTELNNFVIGRKTYEAVKAWGEDYGFDDFVNATKSFLLIVRTLLHQMVILLPIPLKNHSKY